MLRIVKKPDCHPERRHVARGMCPSCYQMWYVKNKDTDSIHIPRTAECHPERGHMAKGLCGPCYSKSRVQGRRYRKYGITFAQFSRLMELQDERCAVCGDSARLVIDHDHVTGAVRGLLCNECNLVAGAIEKSSDRLDRIRSYLNRSVREAM